MSGTNAELVPDTFVPAQEPATMPTTQKPAEKKWPLENRPTNTFEAGGFPAHRLRRDLTHPCASVATTIKNHDL